MPPIDGIDQWDVLMKPNATSVESLRIGPFASIISHVLRSKVAAVNFTQTRSGSRWETDDCPHCTLGRLCHKDCEAGATVHEAGAGYFAQLRWQRSAPLFATEAEGVDGAPEPEAIR